MSSILKALKKLENEKANKKIIKDNNSFSETFVAKDAIKKSIKKDFKIKYITYIVIVAFISLISFKIYSYNFNDVKAIALKNNKPNLKPNLSEKLQNNKKPLKILKQLKITTKTKNNLLIIPEKKLNVTAQKKTEVTLPKKIQVKTNPIFKKDLVKTKVTTLSFPSQIEEINNHNLKIHAIAWAKEPKKRMAVINNKIAKEGYTIYGYLVKQINPKEIIVQNQNRIGKITFKIN